MKKFNKKISLLLASVCTFVVATFCVFGVLIFNQQSVENGEIFPQIFSESQNVNSYENSDSGLNNTVWPNTNNECNGAEFNNEPNGQLDEEVIIDEETRYANVFGDSSISNVEASSSANRFRSHNVNAQEIYYKLDKTARTLQISGEETEGWDSFNSSEPAPWTKNDSEGKSDQKYILTVDIVSDVSPVATVGWFGCQSSPSGQSDVQLSNIQTITGMDHLDMSNCTDASYMFVGSNRITSIDASDKFFKSISNISIASSMCNYTSLSNEFLNKIALQIAPTVTNAFFAFAHNSNLTSFNLGRDVEFLKLTNAKCMFYQDYNLLGISAKSLISTSCTDVSHMFNCCENLLNITLGEVGEDVDWSNTGVYSNLVYSDYMFYKCNRLSGDEGTIYLENRGGVKGITFARSDRAMSGVDNVKKPGFFSAFQATKKITIEFTNNYMDERVKKILADTYEIEVDVNKSFSFQTGIDASYGEPFLEYNQERSGIKSSYNPTTGKITFSSEIGITDDCAIWAKYGPPICVYNIHCFYEKDNGDWTEEAVVTWGGAEEGTLVPTADDKDAGLTDELAKMFEYDASGPAYVQKNGSTIASLYYRRIMRTVSYDTNGGLGGPVGTSLRVGSTDQNSKTLPTNAGYTFKGWYTTKDVVAGEEPVFDPSNEYYKIPSLENKDANRHITLYAHWTPPEKSYMTIVYWGENAEHIDSSNDDFVKEDYSYLSECYIKGDFNSYFDITKRDGEFINPYKGQEDNPDKPLTKIEYIDADNIDEATVPIGDCYIADISKSHYDNPVMFTADNHAVYNVYLKRCIYKWEFYDSTSSSASLIGSITARWNQDVHANFNAICKATWTGSSFGSWQIKGYNYDTYEWVATLTNMPRENKTGKYSLQGGGGLAKYDESGDKTNLRYCIQKLDAEADTHPNIQSSTYLNDNYDLYTTFTTGSNYNFSDEEFINIEGFITPTAGTKIHEKIPYYDNSADAPQKETIMKYDENDTYSGWTFYYKRSKHILSLLAIDAGDEGSQFYEYDINDVLYQKKLGDIEVPVGVPGKFVKDGQETSEHLLRYFIPDNPAKKQEYGSLDPNFVFDGWALNNAYGSESVDLDSLYMPNAGLSIYAKWKAPEVKVTFNQVSTPKTEDVESSKTLNGVYNQKLTGQIPIAKDFERYYFEYWYYHEIDSQGEDRIVYFDPESMLLPNKDLVLFPEYSCKDMEAEFSITVDNQVDRYHGKVEMSTDDKPIYAIEKTKIIITDQTNVITIYASNFTDETITAEGVTDYSGVYTFDKWQINKDSGWSDLVSGEEIKGNYVIRALFKTSSDQYAVTTPPSALPDLQYTGAAQSIANTGSAETGATMKYCVSQSEKLPALSEYKDTIDQATNAGKYYVYYYAKAPSGSTKYSSAVTWLEVEIAKAPMNISIRFLDREKWWDSGLQLTIRDNECYEPLSEQSGFEYSKVNTETLLYVTGNEVGTYYGPNIEDCNFVYNDNNYYGVFKLITGGKARASLTIYNNPVKKEPVVNEKQKYTGSPLNLIKTPGESIELYAIQYGYSKDASVEPESWNSGYETIQATDAGTYYIWIMVQNDDNRVMKMVLPNPAVIYTQTMTVQVKLKDINTQYNGSKQKFSGLNLFEFACSSADFDFSKVWYNGNISVEGEACGIYMSNPVDIKKFSYDDPTVNVEFVFVGDTVSKLNINDIELKENI